MDQNSFCWWCNYDTIHGKPEHDALCMRPELFTVPVPGWGDAPRVRITLDAYQAANLLWLINLCGYPAATDSSAAPFTLANTGDWLGEIGHMLEFVKKDLHHAPNSTVDAIRTSIKHWKDQ